MHLLLIALPPAMQLATVSSVLCKPLPSPHLAGQVEDIVHLLLRCLPLAMQPA